MRLLFTGAAVLAAATLLASAPIGSTVSTAQPADRSPRLHDPHPCADAAGFTCSTLTVPVDHRHRTPGRLALPVAVQDKPGAHRDLLVLAGGPGQPGVIYAPQLAKLTATLPDYRLVMFDQRGTGGAALDCPELQDEMGAADLPPTPQAIQDCVRRLGPAGRFYSTADTVADIDDLRDALGDRTLSLDGISYGTFVGTQYAKVHPHRVHQLILDSVAPERGPEPLLTTPMRATARVLRAACATRQCPGDVVADLAKVVRARTDGATLLNIFGSVGYGNPDYEGLPELLHQAANGDMLPLDDAVAGFLSGDPAPIAEYSQGLHVATWCADTEWPWHSARATYAQRVRALDAAVRRLPRSAVYPFDHRAARTNGIEEACLLWPYAPEHQSHRRMPDVPVLLLGGDCDLLTPIEWLRAVARHTPDPTVVIVHGASHSLQLHTDQGLAAAREFLARH